MNPVKRLGLVVLVLILGAIFGASPAFAANVYNYTYTLAPPVIGPPEPEASGKVTDQRSLNRKWLLETGEVTVSCKSLTPVNEYCVVFLVQKIQSGWPPNWVYEWYYEHRQHVAADKNGRLTTQLSYLPFYYDTATNIVAVWVENDEGRVVLETEP